MNERYCLRDVISWELAVLLFLVTALPVNTAEEQNEENVPYPAPVAEVVEVIPPSTPTPTQMPTQTASPTRSLTEIPTRRPTERPQTKTPRPTQTPSPVPQKEELKPGERMTYTIAPDVSQRVGLDNPLMRLIKGNRRSRRLNFHRTEMNLIRFSPAPGPGERPDGGWES